MSNSRRVVITGLGPVTPSGIGKAAFWEGLHSGISPVRPITRFDASPFKSRIAAELTDFDPEAFMDRKAASRLDRFAQIAVVSTHLALDDAALDAASLEPDRVAVQMGSALGGMAHAELQVVNFMRDGVRAVDARLATLAFGGAASCQAAIAFGFTGPNSTNAMSCASGTIAVGDAFRLIQAGLADVAVAGGIEAPLAPLCFGSFAIIRAMSHRNNDPGAACRPFDRDRDGFVMGEAGAVLILEEAEHARARGAHVYAEIRGFAVTNDAYNMAAPRPTGTQAAAAMRGALAAAGLPPSAVDHVNAHGSSTPLNDNTESQAIRMVLGHHADAVTVSGTKPFYGHALGASGAIEVAISCLAMEHGWAPPTLNLHEPGEGCDLDYVGPAGRPQVIRTVMSNSFGFGGINASLILSSPQ